MARTVTDNRGNAGLSIPGNMTATDLALSIHTDGITPRSLHLDGTPPLLDPREVRRQCLIPVT